MRVCTNKNEENLHNNPYTVFVRVVWRSFAENIFHFLHFCGHGVRVLFYISPATYMKVDRKKRTLPPVWIISSLYHGLNSVRFDALEHE